ncbi:hypothetical protein MP228_011159 [Amoeboaphelidium protococcarum]|nr:hypothetical protein MP228_011159 [Amoeboaphelidium protococcarum]
MPFVANVSKYRNAVAKPGKKEEWYSELPSVYTGNDACNSVESSLKWLAYRTGSSGQNVQFLDVYKAGKYHAMSDMDRCEFGAGCGIVDFKFSPFDSDVLLAGCEDQSIRVIKVQDKPDGKPETLMISCIKVPHKVDCLEHHPSCANLISAGCDKSIHLIDYGVGSVVGSWNDHGDVIQSTTWKSNGQLCASVSKDCFMRVFDVRKDSSVGKVSSHAGSKLKGSRVQWLGNSNYVLSTGFGAQRQREYALYDHRNLSSAVDRQTIPGSSGTALLLPVFDVDTNIIYMVSRGETSLRWLEFNSSVSSGSMLSPVQSAILPASVSGACLLRKRSLNVMEAEINRLICVQASEGGASSSALVPVSFSVPRKSYRDFSSDLFGNGTAGSDPFFQSYAQLIEAKYDQGDAMYGLVPTVSLDPADGYLVSSRITKTKQSVQSEKQPQASSAIKKDDVSMARLNLKDQTGGKESPLQSPSSESNTSRRASNTPLALQNVRKSTYRYILGTTQHQSKNFENVQSLNILPGESDMLHSNSKFLAYPIMGAGGRVVVLPTSKPGRLPPVTPCVINGVDLLDLSLSRLQPDLLLTGCEDGKVRVWKLPEDGTAKKDLTEPFVSLSGHQNRVNIVKFHPYVSSLAISAEAQGMSTQTSIKLWDINAGRNLNTLSCFQDVVQSIDVNMDGSGTLATSCKDKLVRLIDPRQQKESAAFAAHEGIRGSRVFWVDSHHVASAGFGHGSQRELSLFDIRKANVPLQALQFDVSPAIYVPHFDADTSVVYLCGRGDTSIQPVDITLSHSTEPLYALPKFESVGASIQQGTSFCSKKYLDAKNIEFGRCYRLTLDKIETISFSMPRNRREYFQDDIFPVTIDDELATMSADDWASKSKDVAPSKSLNLQPAGMTPLSQAPVEQRRPSKYVLETGERPLTDSQKQEKFLTGMFKNAKDEIDNTPLVQDKMEGVDESEWD